MGCLKKLTYAKIALAPALLLTTAWPGLAQTQPPPPKPTPPPVEQPAQLPTREARAQAYAKLLEGQRYIWQLRYAREDAKFDQLVQQARVAFQEAVKFDPTFAEGHTALARLAFEYPPQDLELADIDVGSAIQASSRVVSRGVRTAR